MLLAGKTHLMIAFSASHELTPEELKQMTQLTGNLRNSCTKGEETKRKHELVTSINDTIYKNIGANFLSFSYNSSTNRYILSVNTYIIEKLCIQI